MNNSFGKKSLKIITVSSMLAAISIILGKFLAINVSNVLRFSFENTPILFSSILLGPIAGVLTATVADLVGCLIVGYEINPLVTLGAAAVAFVCGITNIIMQKIAGSRLFSIAISVLLGHLVGSVIIKTVGLSIFYAMPLHILMLWRALIYLITGAVETVILYYILNHKAIKELI